MRKVAAVLDVLRTGLSRCAALYRVRQLDEELDEEVRSHLEMAQEEYRAQGMTEEEARQAALRSFGGVTQVREKYRLRRGLPFLEHLRRDAGYALRQMRRGPGFAATVIGTLALGIGAAAAMFTVVDHVLLNPVPYRDAGRLVSISEYDGKGPVGVPAPWPDIEQWQKQSRSFDQIAFSSGWGEGRQYISGQKGDLEVSVSSISTNLFPTLGVHPALGRGFLNERPGAAAGRNVGTILLGDMVWKTAFSSDPHIVGRVVKINRKPYTVVGVMPAGFRFPVNEFVQGQVWLPAELSKGDEGRGMDAPRLQVIARLRRGVSLQAAAAEMAVIQKRVASLYPTAQLRAEYGHVRLEPYLSELVQADVRKALLALLAAAGLLWLIATVNVTNLLLARSTARQREIAVRAALGAGRRRVVEQMLVEGLVLSAAGSLLGVAMATASVKLLSRELALRLTLPVPATPDGPILLALLVLTLSTAVIASAWPAWMSARAPIEPALRQGSLQAGTGRRHHRMRGVLVAVEIALSLTLLVGCGLLLRTIYALRQVPLGYRTDHIIVAHLSIPSYRFAGKNMTSDLYEPMLGRVKHLHGVQNAGLMTEVPLGNTFSVQMTLYMQTRVMAWFKAATPEIRQVFGVNMVAGRYFNADDTPTSLPVVVVNEAFARAYSPEQHNPAAILGKKLMATKRGEKTGAGAEIIGVERDAHQFGIGLPSQPEMELCLNQVTPENNFYDVMDGIAMDLAVRTQQPTSVMIPELRDVLRQANPELANSTITTMDQIVADSYGSQTLAAHLLEIFGGAALLLCVAGLYGLLAYVVSQRTRELGVRIALGAQRGDLLWLVMRQAGVMLLAGVAAGTGMALAGGRLVQSFLYGVSAHDGWTLAGAALLLLGSGLVAAYLPARRAAGVDPMRALRAE